MSEKASYRGRRSALLTVNPSLNPIITSLTTSGSTKVLSSSDPLKSLQQTPPLSTSSLSHLAFTLALQEEAAPSAAPYEEDGALVVQRGVVSEFLELADRRGREREAAAEGPS